MNHHLTIQKLSRISIDASWSDNQVEGTKVTRRRHSTLEDRDMMSMERPELAVSFLRSIVSPRRLG